MEQERNYGSGEVSARKMNIVNIREQYDRSTTKKYVCIKKLLKKGENSNKKARNKPRERLNETLFKTQLLLLFKCY